MYTVRDLLAVDAGKTLSDIASIGFREVELFGFGGNILADNPLFGMSSAEFAAALENAGLTAPIAHISGDADNIPELAELAHAIGANHLVVSIAPEFLSFEDGKFEIRGVTGRDQLDRIAERLNRQGEQCRASGIGFGYHNHQMEFASLGDENAYDYLMSQADADLVKLELDVGWASIAGVDPASVIERYAGRVIACHLKDYDPSLPLPNDLIRFPIPEQAQVVEPGAGQVDFGRVVAALDKAGVRHRFVEIDVTSEPMRAIREGYRHLTHL